MAILQESVVSKNCVDLKVVMKPFYLLFNVFVGLDKNFKLWGGAVRQVITKYDMGRGQKFRLVK